jgi:pimeloyl-ACP methyl ester carboxylesterase
MFNPTSSHVVVNGIKLHYYRTGGNKPSLVLSHGITDDGMCWAPLAEVLANDFDVVMVDARGHGKSDAPEDGYTLQNLGVELAGVIQALELDQPILLGHSMGAITALVTAGLYPSLPRAILLEDPPPFWMNATGTSRDENFKNGFITWVNSIKRKTRGELLSECREQNPAWSEAELEPWINSKHRVSPKVTTLIDPPDMISIDLPNLFKRITCPILFISAEAGRGAASSEKDIAGLKTYIPQMQVTHIADAGHSIRREQFARYLGSIKTFVKGL